MLDLMSYLSGGGHRIKLKRHEYIRVGLITTAILLLILLISLELKHFNNTFEAKTMVLIAMFVGLLLGVFLSYKTTNENKKMETLTKFQIWVALLICCTLVMPFLVSFTNRVLSFRGIEEVPVTFVQTEGFYADRYGLLDSAEPDGYFLFVLKDDNLVRLKTRKNPFPNAKENKTVLLPLRKGFWGFNYADL
ncbi:MAG: hypothetical protein ACI8YQ_003176 [Polaribacter sp.]|jgi:hypothetical protein